MQRDHLRLHRSLAVLGPPRRFQLMLLLLSGVDRSVSQLARAVRLSQSCTTRHLQSLERAGLVKGLRDGKRVVFRPAPRDATARGVLASLLRNAEDLGGEAAVLAAGNAAAAIPVASTAELEPIAETTIEDEAPRARERARTARPSRRAWVGPQTIAVDAPPAGAFVVAGSSKVKGTSHPSNTAGVMLAAGRSRRDGSRRSSSRRTARPERAPAAQEPRSEQVRAVRIEHPPEAARPVPDEQGSAPAPSPAPEPAVARAPEAPEPRVRSFDTAFEPEFEPAFRPTPRAEPESGNRSEPHEPPRRHSSDIEDFLL